MSNPRRPRIQCKACPWKQTTDPHDIPNGYCELKHQRLASTIAEPGSVANLYSSLHIMACHETGPGRELPCVGWLVHQLGLGNNIPLRLAVISGRINANVETVGPQHETFEATLPKSK